MVIIVEMKPRQRKILKGLSPLHSGCIVRAETHNAHGEHSWRAPLMDSQGPQAALPDTQICLCQSEEDVLHGNMHQQKYWSQAKRRKGVQWPDEAAQQSGQQLEKVIGYTDGGSFASRIGPQAVNSSRAGGGRFADLVQSRVIAAKESVGQQQDEHLRAADVEGIGIARDFTCRSTTFIPS